MLLVNLKRDYTIHGVAENREGEKEPFWVSYHFKTSSEYTRSDIERISSRFDSDVLKEISESSDKGVDVPAEGHMLMDLMFASSIVAVSDNFRSAEDESAIELTDVAKQAIFDFVKRDKDHYQNVIFASTGVTPKKAQPSVTELLTGDGTEGCVGATPATDALETKST